MESALIGMSRIEKAEKVLFAAGVVLLSVCAFSYVLGRIQAHLAVREFRNELSLGDEPTLTEEQSASGVDNSLWSDKRIREYEASFAMHFDRPVALLRIPRLRLEVPVFDGTDELVLNRGVGRIIGTGSPGEQGNIAIAGHRDGFFRRLKDIGTQDTVQLLTRSGVQTYVVDSVRIVSPDDVSVLRTGESPAVTLVTCYPFYFIGSAPKRLVVHASLRRADMGVARRSAQVSSTGTNF